MATGPSTKLEAQSTGVSRVAKSYSILNTALATFSIGSAMVRPANRRATPIGILRHALRIRGLSVKMEDAV